MNKDDIGIDSIKQKFTRLEIAIKSLLIIYGEHVTGIRVFLLETIFCS